MSDIQSTASSNVKNNDKGNVNNFELLLAFFPTEDKFKYPKKSKQQANKTNLQKQANFLDEIFDYIHNASC